MGRRREKRVTRHGLGSLGVLGFGLGVLGLGLGDFSGATDIEGQLFRALESKVQRV